MSATATENRPLRIQRAEVADLREGAIAGRRVRLPSGQAVPMGSPLSRDQLKDLASGGVNEIEVLSGTALRSDSVTSPATQARATMLQAVMRANLATRPPARRAADGAHGQAAGRALEVAVATAAWFAPISDLLIRQGLQPHFLGHAMETSLLAAVTGSALGWEEETLSDLALAAMLADVGMLMIPEALRTKPGRLSRLERRELENHPRLGADALAPLARIAPLVPLVAIQHHERYDGGGYPAGLSRGDIRPESMVVALCHRYIAAVTTRNYRLGVPPHQAMELMQTLGDALAPTSIVQAFMNSVAIYPVGSQVRLSDGRVGRVRDVGTAGRPTVEVLFDENGEPTEAVYEDLAVNPTLFIAASSN
jgi:HD-GYP domain-containing protein (c-di-GMP phosphodiesterase class II)